MTFRLLQSCEIPPHWYEGARILRSWEHADPAYPGLTAAPSPVLLQSPQISCSALSSVWHIWYLANSAVILQWIDSVPSAQYTMPCNVSKLSPRPFSRLWPGAVAAVARLLTASNQFASLAGPRTGTSLTPASGQWSPPSAGQGQGEKGRMLKRDGVELSAVCCPTQGWEPGRLFLEPLSTTNCTEMEDDGTKYF